MSEPDNYPPRPRSAAMQAFLTRGEDYDYEDTWEPDDYLCETCLGALVVSRAEYECDWVNFSNDDFIACPDCASDRT